MIPLLDKKKWPADVAAILPQVPGFPGHNLPEQSTTGFSSPQTYGKSGLEGVENIREIAYRPEPGPDGSLVVDPEIHLPSPGMDVDIAYYYISNLFSGINRYGHRRTISVDLRATPIGTALPIANTPAAIEFVRGDGSVVSYGYSGTGSIYEPTTPGLINKLDVNFNAATSEIELTETTSDGRQTYYAGLTTPGYGDLPVYWAADAVGNRHTFSYGAGFAVNLTKLTDAVGRAVSFTFSGNRLQSIQDWAGRRTTFQYGKAGSLDVLTTLIGPTGCITKYGYSGTGDLTSITDPNGNLCTYEYSDGQVVKRTIGGQYITTYTYTDDETTAIYPDASIYTNSLDGYGFIGTVTQAGSAVTTVARNTSGLQNNRTDPRGGRTTTRYTTTAQGFIVPNVVIDPLGNITTYTYDAYANITAINYPDGARWSMGYSAPGEPYTAENRRVYWVVDPYGDRTTFGYNNRGQLRTVKDPLGFVYTTAYDALGNLSNTVDQYGYRTTFQYDAAGNVTTLINALGRVSTFAYDQENRMTSATNPLGQRTQWGYDSNGNMNVVVDPLGNDVNIQYNVWDLPGVVIDQRNYRTTYTYNGMGNLTSVINALGEISLQRNNAVRRTIVNVDPANNSTTSTFDELGRLIGVQDALSRSTTYAYDAIGRQIRTVFPDGSRITVAYNTINGTMAVQNELGKVTTTTVDRLGRLRSTAEPTGAVTTLIYTYAADKSGKVQAIQDANNRRTTLLFDRREQLRSVTDPLGQRTSYSYDPLGQLTEILDALGNRTTFQYDAAGRLTTFINALGRRTTYQYDAAGRLTTVVDARGNLTGRTYDPAGNLTRERDPSGYITSITYDPLNRPSTVKDAEGNVTSYEYDNRGFLESTVDAAGGRTTYLYNAVGLPTTVISTRNLIATYLYDNRNRLNYARYADGSRVTLSYDAASRRTTMVDSLGTTTYKYDDVARLKEVTYPGGLGLSYTYDLVGNRRSLRNPQGGLTTYAYDANNRLTTLTNDLGEVTQVAYDALNRPRHEIWANTMRVSHLYDAVGQETTLTYRNSAGTTMAQYTAAYDAVGNRVAVREYNGAWTTYVYDPKNQLIEEYRSGTSAYRTTYSYDKVGNRLTERENGQLTSYEYGPMNRLLEVTAPGGALTTYAYTAGGVRTEKNALGTTTYTYDALDRMSNVVYPDGSQYGFRYDGDGVRRRTTPPGTTTNFVWDGDDLLQELNASNVLVANYTLLPDQLDGFGMVVSQRRGANSSFFSLDLTGNTRQLFSSAQNSTDTYLYGAFGNEIVATGSTTNSLRFGGGWGYHRDDASDRLFVRARYYEPSTGRWMNPDPTGFAGGDVNLFRYVSNDPVGLNDPSGLAPATPPTTKTWPLKPNSKIPCPNAYDKKGRPLGEFTYKGFTFYGPAFVEKQVNQWMRHDKTVFDVYSNHGGGGMFDYKMNPQFDVDGLYWIDNGWHSAGAMGNYGAGFGGHWTGGGIGGDTLVNIFGAIFEGPEKLRGKKRADGWHRRSIGELFDDSPTDKYFINLGVKRAGQALEWGR